MTMTETSSPSFLLFVSIQVKTLIPSTCFGIPFCEIFSADHLKARSAVYGSTEPAKSASEILREKESRNTSEH